MKPNLYIDFDDTMVNSLEIVLDILNKAYNTHFTVEESNKWDFSDTFPNITQEESENAFSSKEFWQTVKLKDGVIESLYQLQYYYNIYIISKGNTTNLEHKTKFLQRELQDINFEFIPLSIGESKGNYIQTQDSVFIDDNEKYLTEADACVKILFVTYPNKQWNSHWNGMAMKSWDIDTCLTLIKIAKGMKGEISHDRQEYFFI